MRWMKILLVLVVAAMALAGPANAQIDCSTLVKSLSDSVGIQFFSGKPGDTVMMPFYLKNSKHCTSFQMLFQFDTTKLTPAFKRDSICDSIDLGNCVHYTVDSTYIDFAITGRYLDTDTNQFNGDIDTVTKFQANLFTPTINQTKRNVVSCSFLPALNDIDSIPIGGGTIFYIKFIVKPGLLHNTTAGFTFYESNICYDTGIPPVTVCAPGCWESQLSLDTTIGSQNQTLLVYPRYASPNGFFRVDTSTVANPTMSVSVNPTNIQVGNSSTLSWTATNADQVQITANPALAGFPMTTSSLTGSTSVSPTQNTTFTATATKGTKTAVNSTTLTVGVVGTGPTISYTPAIQNYTINQGETVSFQVRATGNSGQTITLSAGTLPNNATFAPTNPVTGATFAQGTFSFTPDFNQQGGFSITFTGSSSSGTSNSSVLITVNQLEKDRLFSTSAAKQKPVGGLRGTGGVKFPINLISAKTVYGVNFDLDFPYNYVAIDSFVVTGRIPDYVVYDNLGETPGTVRVAAFGLANDSVLTDTSTAILYAYMSLDSNAVPWTDYPINMRNGRESVNPNPNFPTLELQTDSGIIQCDNPGDVNLDKIIDVGDFVNIVSSIIQTFTLSNRQFRAADIIVNDSVNVFDLVADINLFYNRPINPAPPAPAAPATVTLTYNDIPMGGSDILVVNSELPQEVAAVQMDISYDPNAVALGTPRVTVDNANYVLQYKDNGSGKMRVLMYYPDPYRTANLMQAGAAQLINVPVTAKSNLLAGDKTKLRLTEALLSTPTSASIVVKGTDTPLPTGFVLSQNYPNPFNPTTVIEYSIGTIDGGSSVKHVQLEIYNVLGQLVRTLVDAERGPGSYTAEWDATSNAGQRVSSGVYLYRLQVGSDAKTKKMLLLK